MDNFLLEDRSRLMLGDCLERMKEISSGTVDMIFTSPPYADQRKTSYSSCSANDYIDWFKPMAIEMKRVLSDTGSFFLNIKSHTENGERSLYVMELVIALKNETGFKFVDELCWTKNAYPGSFKGRFKNGFEPIYHFTKKHSHDITFNPLACGTKIKPTSIERSYRKRCGSPKNGSGMSNVNPENLQNIDLVRPSNVINIHNINNQHTDKQKHPATFPEKLVEFFIYSFTNKDNIVLDPFMGSGTSGVAAISLDRKFIGIELDPGYFDLAKSRINNETKQRAMF